MSSSHPRPARRRARHCWPLHTTLIARRRRTSSCMPLLPDLASATSCTGSARIGLPSLSKVPWGEVTASVIWVGIASNPRIRPNLRRGSSLLWGWSYGPTCMSDAASPIDLSVLILEVCRRFRTNNTLKICAELLLCCVTVCTRVVLLRPSGRAKAKQIQEILRDRETIQCGGQFI